MKQDPLEAHSHDNNTQVPGDDPSLAVHLPDGSTYSVTPADLRRLPPTTLKRHMIVTDHGAHGPYALQGVALADLIDAYWSQPYSAVEVVSADGYGNRVYAAELTADAEEPILLSYASDGKPLTRRHGLVRLIVPSERDNALRQIKWVATIRVCA